MQPWSISSSPEQIKTCRLDPRPETHAQFKHFPPQYDYCMDHVFVPRVGDMLVYLSAWDSSGIP
jgi:hypothetical protein